MWNVWEIVDCSFCQRFNDLLRDNFCKNAPFFNKNRIYHWKLFFIELSLLIIYPGIYSGVLCASLASYGFVVVALEHRDRSSCWTFSLETDALSGIVIEKPILMTTYPDGEGEFKRCNKQLHKRVAECVRALNVMEEVSNKFMNFCVIQTIRITGLNNSDL
jgi:hypothetical protein